ncbi:growth-regulating factor 5 isoform X2 [Morus notabilis]|uniref:growth-regulating factor 5 isoform X2 n=1 Tax=Morus notabilis TaxID=981085 RepID=UPI000CECFC95|nr:growth-regulating factor 5 isoform X2 [Morus notabilis]
MISANASARNRSPFTATQWQELEHQALIFKYMVSGVPIPPDLIYSVKRSLDSSFSSRLFSHHPTGWGCFEMGFGRKVDPEPGRCRRTDGKKWRCSKEAYPDSKYCERHMHRGRNRSRKPVEVSSSSTTITTATNATTTITNPSPVMSSVNRDLSSTTPTISSYSQLPSSMMSESLSHHPSHHNPSLYPFAYPHSSSSRPPDYGLSTQNASNNNNSSPYFCLKSESYSTQSDKDYRYFHGTKESMDELAFFPESSGNARNFPESCHSLMSSYRGYSQPQFQGLTDNSKEPMKQSSEDQQHCFILGTDFKSERANESAVKEADTQKPLHHFFGEWPPKNTAADSWLDLASNSRVPNDG